MAHDLEKKSRTRDVLIEEVIDFSSLLLNDRVVAGLTKAGFKKPSPIQLKAIPVGRFGKDLWVQAKSGTGKTLVFVIVALEMLLHQLFRPQVLILVPTREIATQIHSVIKNVGSSFRQLTCGVFIGGLPVADDIKKAHDCQIVVGTPGRIKQLLNIKALNASAIRLVVFDEADQLLEYKWQEDIEAIFNTLPEEKQVIATSATYPAELESVMLRYLRDTYIARLDSEKPALLGIIHYAKIVESSCMPLKQYDLRLAALRPILKTLNFTQCLVYCNGIHKVEVLHRDIKKWGFSTTFISKSRTQADRLKAIELLKRFRCKVLVSSDVTSRGIDAENVDLVVNFDLSTSVETYLHRSGRAGRYGTMGVTISIIDTLELQTLEKFEKAANFKSYILPDPLPDDLIQNPSFDKYVFEISDKENEPTPISDACKIEQPSLNKKSLEQIQDNSEFSIYGNLEVSTICDDTTKSSKSLEVKSDSVCQSKGSVKDSQDLNFEISSLKDSIISSVLNECNESDVSIPSPFENLCTTNEITEVSDVESKVSAIQSATICDDTTKSSKSLEVKSDSVCQSKGSVKDSHDLNFEVPSPKDSSIISSVLNECNEPDVSIPSPLENLCAVNEIAEVSDVESKVSAIQSDNAQDIESTFSDACLKSPIADKTDLDVHNNELSKVIETFVNNYEADRNRKSTNVLSNKGSLVAENIKTDTVLASNLTDLNSKRSDYYYKVCKLFLEENACSNSENKMQESLEGTQNNENEFYTKGKAFLGEANDEEIKAVEISDKENEPTPISDACKIKQPSLNKKSLEQIQDNSEFSIYGNLEVSTICDDTTKSSKSLEVKSDSVCQSKGSVKDSQDLNFEISSLKDSIISSVLNECNESDVSIPSPFENLCTTNEITEVSDVESKVSAIQSDNAQGVESTFSDASLKSPIADKTDLNVHNNELSKVVETFVNNYEADRSRKSTNVLSNKGSLVTENIKTDTVLARNLIDLNSKRSDYYYKVCKLFLEENACSNSENKMQESLEGTQNNESEFCTKGKAFLGEANDEEIKAKEEHQFVRDSENLKELSDNSNLENDSIPNYDNPDLCEMPCDEITQYWDKSKYKVAVLFDGSAVDKSLKLNSSDELSDDESDSESDIESGVKASIDTVHCSSEDSQSESCSDISGLSSTSFSVESDSSEDNNGRFHDRESFDGFSSSSERKLLSGNRKVPVHYHHTCSSQFSANGRKSQQLSHSRFKNTLSGQNDVALVNAFQQAYHSGYLNACQQSSRSRFENTYPNQQHCCHLNASQQPHFPRCSNTHQNACNSEYFPVCHHPQKFSSSECKKRRSREKFDSVHKKNQPSCSSGFKEQSFKPEHRCHPNNASIDCNQRKICAQCQQPHFPRCSSAHQNTYNFEHFPVCNHPHKSSSSECKKCRSNKKYDSVHKKNQPSCSSGFKEQHSPLCFKPEHRCHPYNASIDCNQREICAQWYEVFYNQWMHIQRQSLNFPFPL